MRKKKINQKELLLFGEASTGVCNGSLNQIFIRPSQPKPTKIYETYWRFAAERQEIFFRKLYGLPSPWTNDKILSIYKFTNAYRASDRVSQYLIQKVIYGDDDQTPEEVFFRIILFKVFNKIDTWELLLKNLGKIRYSEYRFDIYNKVLSKYMAHGQPIYSAAYIMSSGRSAFGYPKKHQNHLRLIEKMMQDRLPQKVTELVTMRDLFELLRSYPGIGDFLAYQYATDLNYSRLTDFNEMDFVMPGPGAKDGIRKCFDDLGGYSENEIIEFMVEDQVQAFRRFDIDFRSLWGRPLQLIDCQNLFCEVDKYSRVAHPEFNGIRDRKRIKQKYSAHPEKLSYWYPPKWNINDLIVSENYTDKQC